MSTSEVITICLLFHLSGLRCFKHFYLFYLQRHMQAEFPRTVSYNRFVELSQSVLLPMSILLKTCCLGCCTGIRNNMKNSLMSLQDKIMLGKRSVIETVNDELKNICQLEHSRHRSFTNFMANMVAGLIAYAFLPKKPSISYKTAISEQLAFF